MEWLGFILPLAGLLILGYAYIFAFRRQAATKLSRALGDKAIRIDAFPGGTGLATDAKRLAICAPFLPTQVLAGHEIRRIDVRGELGEDWLGHPTVKHRLWIGVRSNVKEPTTSIMLPSEQVARDWVELIEQLLDDGTQSTANIDETLSAVTLVELPVLAAYHEIAGYMRNHGFDSPSTRKWGAKRKAVDIIAKALLDYRAKDPTRRFDTFPVQRLASFLETQFKHRGYKVGTLRAYISDALKKVLKTG